MKSNLVVIGMRSKIIVLKVCFHFFDPFSETFIIRESHIVESVNAEVKWGVSWCQLIT